MYAVFPGEIACVVGVVEVNLTALLGVALITVIVVAVLSSVVEGALLIASVVGYSSVVPTGTGDMNEKRMILYYYLIICIAKSLLHEACFYNCLPNTLVYCLCYTDTFLLPKNRTTEQRNSFCVCAQNVSVHLPPLSSLHCLSGVHTSARLMLGLLTAHTFTL